MAPDEPIITPSRGVIRFKFMPTPSGRLHIGHAWLLIVMHYLVKQAKQAGRQADIVLVFDDLTSLGGGPEERSEKLTNIMKDAAWLGIEFAKVVGNLSCPYESDVKTSMVHCVSCSTVAPASLYPPHLSSLMLGSQYYIKNCIIDAALEVTHIIRGADQLARVAVYKVLYEFLGMPSPRLVYLPFVCRDNCSKISADNTYSVEAVQKHISRDDLVALLVTSCLKRPDGLEKPSNIQEAEKQLLGGDWDWILGQGDSGAKLTSFLNRLESVPKISTEQLGIKVQTSE